MIPLLAAASAVSQIGATAISQLTGSSATNQAAGKKAAGTASDSFATLLAAHGVSSSGPTDSSAVGLGTAVAGPAGG
jgi:hypothetical protein